MLSEELEENGKIINLMREDLEKNRNIICNGEKQLTELEQFITVEISKNRIMTQ